MAVYPVLILFVAVGIAVTGFLFFVGRRRPVFNAESLTAALPLLFTASYGAEYVVSIGLWPAALLTTAVVVGFFIPLTVLAERSSMPKPAGFGAVRSIGLLMTFAAVFKLLTANGLNPITVFIFAASGFVYTSSAGRLGRISALALSNITAAAGLYLSFVIPGTIFTTDITLIVAIIMLYSLGTLSQKNLERFIECLTPVHLSLLTVLAAAVLFSPLSSFETVDSELRLDQAFFLIPAVFLTFSSAGARNASRFFEAMLFALAASIAAVGGLFPNAAAELLTPLVGAPVKGMASQAVQAVLQLTGLSTLTMVLAKMSEAVQAAIKTRISTALMYGAPAAAIILAVSSVVGQPPGQAILLAGSVNMLTFSLLMVSLGGGWLMPAVFLFITSSSTVIIQAVSQFSLGVRPFNPLVFASLIPSATSMAAVGLGVWGFSDAVVAWLKRRALLTGI
ncbi:MAG: hypothetical protein QW470_03895 [Candidatus Caldarchaeum sp.]